MGGGPASGEGGGFELPAKHTTIAGAAAGLGAGHRDQLQPLGAAPVVVAAEARAGARAGRQAGQLIARQLALEGTGTLLGIRPPALLAQPGIGGLDRLLGLQWQWG
jgi:hypothetical protein